MSWIDRARKNPVLKSLYRLPGIKRLYHLAWALGGAIAYGFPSRGLTVIGVTGTKGKTTVTEFLNAALETAGLKTAILSSVHCKIGQQDARNRTGNSMPGRFFIQRFLRAAQKSGCTHAVIEVTSEGVAQGRHRFIKWSLAAITNIAPEHIESHGSFENYRNVKLSFLKHAVGQGATAFVNADDEHSKYFAENLPAERTVMYSAKEIAGWPAHLFNGLPGEFNRQNVAAVLAIARKLDIPDAAVMEALGDFEGVPGRMEFVQREPFQVIVDYAHTPDSLEAAYKAVRAGMQSGGRLVAVLSSCGGHRDKWKRPVMGGIAARYADEIILTNEDPYDEDPQAIIDEIEKGVLEPRDNNRGAKPFKLVDRGEAIRKAVALARPGDAVIMTGKGSETAIHIEEGKIIEWSDKEEAQRALRETDQ